ncbi:MAG: hypothetical protein HY364_03410 [Candidatus Aenigmarchaeota archaeon]|nr:hypothetical protein [Candidatus Aenigmarchaeota archaeon]
MRCAALVIACLLAAGCVQPNLEYNGYDFAKYGQNGISATGDKVVYFNPSNLPENALPADYIFFSYDDCDKSAAEQLKHNETRIMGPFNCVLGMAGGIYSMEPNERMTFDFGEMVIESSSAIKDNKQGNGYLVTFDGMSLYYNDGDRVSAVDSNVDIAFLTYGGAANTIHPKIAVPLANGAEFESALEGTGIEVRAI